MVYFFYSIIQFFDTENTTEVCVGTATFVSHTANPKLTEDNRNLGKDNMSYRKEFIYDFKLNIVSYRNNENQ